MECHFLLFSKMRAMANAINKEGNLSARFLQEMDVIKRDVQKMILLKRIILVQNQLQARGQNIQGKYT